MLNIINYSASLISLLAISILLVYRKQLKINHKATLGYGIYFVSIFIFPMLGKFLSQDNINFNHSLFNGIIFIINLAAILLIMLNIKFQDNTTNQVKSYYIVAILSISIHLIITIISFFI